MSPNRVFTQDEGHSQYADHLRGQQGPADIVSCYLGCYPLVGFSDDLWYSATAIVELISVSFLPGEENASHGSVSMI